MSRELGLNQIVSNQVERGGEARGGRERGSVVRKENRRDGRRKGGREGEGNGERRHNSVMVLSPTAEPEKKVKKASMCLPQHVASFLPNSSAKL